MPLYRILPGKGEFGARIVKTYELEWGEWVGGERSFLAGKVHSESPGTAQICLWWPQRTSPVASAVDFTQWQQPLTTTNHSQLCDPESF